MMNRTSESPARSYRTMSAAARWSLVVAAGGFVAAGLGYVLNHFVPDTICAEGLAVVGCFYLIIGVVDHLRVRRLKSRRQQITE